MSEYAELPFQPETPDASLTADPSVNNETASPILHQAVVPELPDTHAFEGFLYDLRVEGLSASTSEWLDLQRALREGIIASVDDLYVVSRALLVKDVTGYPQFDRVFGRRFFGIQPTEENQDEYEEDYEEPVQKEPEDIEEVVEATSLTSEDVHGGDEATKDIQDSPSAADNGQNEDNKGAQEGKGEEKGKEEGEGGGGEQENDQGGGNKEETGEGGGDKQESGEGGGKLKEAGEGGDGKKDNDKGGGKRKDKKRKEGTMKPGKGGHSVREQILERRFNEFDPNRLLNDAQFSRALSRLTTIVREASEVPTGNLDADATVRKIAARAGIPELVWREELQSKPRVIMMFDVGGSTDDVRPLIERLFGSAREVLDELEIYYFHNAIYGEVWPASDGNFGTNFIPVETLLKKDQETKVIIVGDGWMGESDAMNGGLYDSYNDLSRSNRTGLYAQSGFNNFRAIAQQFPSTVWLTPLDENERMAMDESGTIGDLEKVFATYHLSLRGLEDAVTRLVEE